MSGKNINQIGFKQRDIRSATYQWKIKEIPCEMSHKTAEWWNTQDGLYPDDEPEVIKELNDRAVVRMMRLMEAHLTYNQLQVSAYIKQGYTEQETYKLMYPEQSAKGLCYPGTINKILKGRFVPKYGKWHGGVRVKIISICIKDEEYKQHIKTLAEYESGYMLRLTLSWFDSYELFQEWVK
jgi:hypothetical protein